MSKVFADTLQPEVRAALNSLSHAAGQSFAIQTRVKMIGEARRLKSEGLTAEEILNKLYAMDVEQQAEGAGE